MPRLRKGISMKRIWIIAFSVLIGPFAHALTPQQAQQMYERIAPSLVVVQFTVEGEFGRRDLYGQGVVIGEEGLVMMSMSVVPTAIPDEQMKDFKVVIPGDDEKELDAIFLGRDERSDIAFLKTKEPQHWPAIKFEDVPSVVGDEVIAVGRLQQDSGYKAYYSQSYVSANLRGPTPFVLVGSSGLTTVGSPVFNATGKAIGLVPYQTGQNQWLNRTSQGLQSINPPARAFVPARDFLASIKDPPDGRPLRIPWIGAQLAGLSKPVAEYYGLKNVPVMQIGDVIPGGPAQKAGLRTGDKITQVNDRPLERGDEPDETPMIFIRNIRRMHAGDSLALTVLREKGQPTKQVRLVLEQQPKASHEARRYFAEDLGMTMREIVFSDTYSKRVPASTRGVVAAYLRQSSSAASAGLKLGDLVVQLNKNPIAGLDDFKQRYSDFRQRSPKELVVLVVIRDQRTEVIKIEPPQ